MWSIIGHEYTTVQQVGKTDGDKQDGTYCKVCNEQKLELDALKDSRIHRQYVIQYIFKTQHAYITY